MATFSKSWGSFLDTENSWNEEYYQMAYKKDKYNEILLLCYANLLKQVGKEQKAVKIL